MRKYAYPLLVALTLAALALAQTYRIGPLPTADGNAPSIRYARTGETVTLAAGGANRERVSRGAMYYAADQGAGVAPGTALGTTAQLVVYNPANSGQIVVIKRVWDTYFSGTLGTGVLYHCVNTSTTQTAPSGGTVLANTPALAGNANLSVAVVRKGATTVQPVIVAPFMYLAPELATSVTAPQQNFEDLDDAIQLLPGTTYQVQAVAAGGTSPLMAPAVLWEERALLNGQP